MPQVPRVQPQSVQQAPITAPQMPTQAPLEAFGGGAAAAGVAQAGKELNRTISQIYMDEKKKADQVAVLGADQQLSRWETAKLYAPETGAFNKKGKDAFGLPEEISADFTKTIGDIESGLNNDDQKLAFRRMAASRGVDIERSVTKHVGAEMRSYDNSVTESYVKSERDAALADFQNPERIDIAIERQNAAIIDYAGREGLPPEYVKLKTAETTSKMRFDVTSRYLAVGDDIAAKAYYDQHKDQFTGGDAMAMDKALEEGSTRGESQRSSDKIMLTSASRAEATASAREIKDPKVREMTESLVNRRWDEKAAEQKDLQNGLYLQATNMLDETGATGKSARQVIPPTTWSQLTLEQRNALEARGTNHSNDDKAWLDFLDLNPNKLASMDRSEFETTYWAHFDDSHRQRAETLWKESKKGGDKNANLTSSLTFKDRVDNSLRTSGLIPASKEKSKFSESEAKLYAQFEGEAAKQVEDFEINDLQGKRKATGTEVQKILDSITVKQVFVDKWGSDAKKLSTFLTEDEKGATYVPLDKMPVASRNSIENILKSKGKRVTSDKVQRAYGAMLTNDRKRFDSIIAE